MHVFDIIGPVMIGPSSSHTAGAARIGRMARRLLGARPARVRLYLHGSFARTYRGHGTDRALIAGILDMPVDDVRLSDSLRLAREAGLDFSFEEIELKDAHPNTVRIEAEGEGGERLSMEAASVGGGAIRVRRLNGLAVDFSGAQNTLVVSHHDQPGVISQVTSLLAMQQVNIATMQVFRSRAGGDAVMVIEIDQAPARAAIDCLNMLNGVKDVTMLEKCD